MKRPLGLIVLVYGCGLLLGEFFPLPLLTLFAISIGLAIGALAIARARPLLIWPLLVCAGWTNFAAQTTPVSPHDLRNLLTDSPAEVSIRGILDSTPSRRVTVRTNRESVRTVAEVRLTHLTRGNITSPALGTVLVTMPAALPPEFFGGREVSIDGVIQLPSRPIAPGTFDYQAYLRRHGIHYQLRAFTAQDWTLHSTNGSPPWSDRFIAWAKENLAEDLPGEDETVRLTRAMVLGLKTELPTETYAPFIHSGTMHLFAISGLHIALLSGILVSLFRVLQIPRLWCGLIVIPLIWFYTAATGWQPSAVRATVMMSIVVGGWSLRRPPDLLNSLAAAALMILLWEPQQLFQAGFQLSFCVVCSIALLVPRITALADRALQHDPLIPRELMPRWRRWLERPLRYVVGSAATSLAAWIGSMPITAHYFHVFSPVTLPANVAIMPFAAAALASNLGSLVTRAWLPWAADLFNHAAWFAMKSMVVISERAADLPAAYFHVRSPSTIEFAIYYGLLIAILSGILRKQAGRRLIAALLATSALLIGWNHHRHRHTSELTVLPLSGGSATFANAPGKKSDLLVDCGNVSSFGFVIQPFLQAQGVNSIPSLALTHGDVRYFGAADLVIKAFRVQEVATSQVKFRSKGYQSLVASLDSDNPPARRRVVHRGDDIAGWNVLHPAKVDRFSQADDNALVLGGILAGTRVLLLSDLGRLGQEALIEREEYLNADIVVAGLPEQSEPLNNALLDLIQPRLIIVTDSEFPATRRAAARLRDRLERRGTRVLFTRDAGAVTLTFSPRGWSAQTMNPDQPPIHSWDLNSPMK